MNTQQKNWLIAVIAMIVLLAVTIVIFMQLRPSKMVNNFEECRDAGGAIMESYPEQCLLNGKTYVNEQQRPIEDTSDYIGMTEDNALTRAEKSNISARVVERDGESLPITMDFVYGRHNLYVKENRVYKVEVEGQAEDSPAIGE